MEVLLGGPDAPVGPLPAGEQEAARRLAGLYAYPAAADQGRAWVRANMVTSLDGAVSGGDGRSASVSSPADKQVFHVLRGLADVVLVGAGTARTERYGPADPHPVLAAGRRAAGRREAAVVVQVTRSGRVQAGKDMFATPGAALVALPAGDDDAYARAVADAGSDAVVLAGHVDRGGTDLGLLLRELAGRGLTRVLCEGGPSLLGALGAADLLDELCLTTSPVVVAGGGPRAVVGEAVGPLGFRLAGLLHADGTLLGRWVRERERAVSDVG